MRTVWRMSLVCDKLSPIVLYDTIRFVFDLHFYLSHIQLMSASDSIKSDSKPRVRKRGRPRAEETRIAILKAAYELLEEGGLSSFTIESVAARAGSAKTTIYRWWPSRESLAVAAFLAVALPEISFPDSGCTADDIKTQMQKVARVYRGKTGRVVRDLVAAGNSDPRAAAAFVEGYVLQRRTAVREVLMRGIRNGEFDANLDVESAIDALYGAMFYRLLVGHGPIDEKFMASTAEMVLAGFAIGIPAHTLVEHELKKKD